MNFGGVLGRPLDTFFWALTISSHGSWLVCEVALNVLFKPSLLSFLSSTFGFIGIFTHTNIHTIYILGEGFVGFHSLVGCTSGMLFRVRVSHMCSILFRSFDLVGHWKRLFDKD